MNKYYILIPRNGDILWNESENWDSLKKLNMGGFEEYYKEGILVLRSKSEEQDNHFWKKDNYLLFKNMCEKFSTNQDFKDKNILVAIHWGGQGGDKENENLIKGMLDSDGFFSFNETHYKNIRLSWFSQNRDGNKIKELETEFLTELENRNEKIAKNIRNAIVDSNIKEKINESKKINKKLQDIFNEYTIVNYSDTNLANKIRNKIIPINLDKSQFNEKDFNAFQKIFFTKVTKFENSLFIFYWVNIENVRNNDIIHKQKEYNEKSWGKTRFFRDFCKPHEIAYEVILSNLNQNNEDELKTKISELKTRITNSNIEIRPSDIFKNVDEKICKTLEKIYGSNSSIILKQILGNTKKERITNYSKLYLYDKNDSYNDNDYDKELAEKLTVNGKKYIEDIVMSSHSALKEIDATYTNFNKDNAFFNKLGTLTFLFHFNKTISYLTSSFTEFYEYQEERSPIFFFLDDSEEVIVSKIEILKIWFPKSLFIFFPKDKIDFSKFVTERDIFNIECELKYSYKDKDYGPTEGGLKNQIREIISKNFSAKSEGKIPIITFIDLEYNGINYGLDILRNLNSQLINQKFEFISNIFPIIFSRYEDPKIIRQAVKNGAFYYIPKSKFLSLIPKVFSLKNSLTYSNCYLHNSSNWRSLSRLEPSTLLKLHNNKISGNEYEVKKENDTEKIIGFVNDYKYSKDYLWIKKLPKADLHSHIGTVLGVDLLPKTALLVLHELHIKNENNFDENLDKIIAFLIPIVFDPNLEENGSREENFLTEEYKKAFLDDKEFNAFKVKSIFQLIEEKFSLSENNKLPEQVLLDPFDTTLERSVLARKFIEKYFKFKIGLREKKIDYDIVVLVFIYLIAYRESKVQNKEYLNDLKSFLEKDLKQIDPLLAENDVAKFEKIVEFRVKLDEFINKQLKEDSKKLLDKSNKILNFLVSAHSDNRCLSNGKGSLFNYLRGCEYVGAPHLQSELSIYFSSKYIIENYAIPDNIRYLSLRCAVDGYSKLKLQTEEEAIEALFNGLNYYSNKNFNNNKKVHCDLIITAKRHKPLKAFEKNVSLAKKYRNGLELNSKAQNNTSFFENKCKVVSFDLAGIEKGNRPSKFYQQFYPLLLDSFPITIHAGEEDSYESIWEAIYLVGSSRIGHGLTLRENKELLEAVREKHIAIELCPLSNVLTRGDKYKFVDTSQIENKNVYPLRQYLDKKIAVTINVDNPTVSNSNLTEEFLVAAKLSGGLTKWEILKIIKNGFKYASIPLPEKNKCMNEIDEEIFYLMQEEES